MRLTLLTLLSLLATAAYSQKIAGKVIDENDNPITAVHIYLKGTQTGAVSDANGRFEFLAEGITDSTILIISAVSYKTLEVKIYDLPSIKNFTARLKSDEIIMREIDVNMKDHEASDIIRQALLNAHDNYDFDDYQLKCHYAEAIRLDNQYQYFTEALFTMQDRGYDLGKDRKFRLDAVRHSKDYRVMDSIDHHYDSFSGNTIEHLFDWDYIDSRGARFSFYFTPVFNDEIVKNFEFLIDSIADYQGHESYYMSFFLNPEKDKWGTMGNRHEYHRIVVTKADHAVVQIVIGSRPKEITQTKTGKIGNSSYVTNDGFTGYKRISYQEKNGKWYPYEFVGHRSLLGGDRQKSSRMAYEKLRSGEAKDSLEYDNVTYNGRKLTPDKNNWYQYYHMTVTDVKSNKDKFKRIRNRELFLSDKAIRNVHTVYDPGLWADYANWDYDQEIRKALKMIEYKLPLEKQFQSSPEFLKRNFVAGIN